MDENDQPNANCELPQGHSNLVWPWDFHEATVDLREPSEATVASRRARGKPLRLAAFFFPSALLIFYFVLISFPLFPFLLILFPFVSLFFFLSYWWVTFTWFFFYILLVLISVFLISSLFPLIHENFFLFLFLLRIFFHRDTKKN